jgi:uncharacterized protein (TIGR02646 family)
MRFIKKSSEEPHELLEYRKSAGKDASWNGFPDKAIVRDRQMEEQGFLCCYCMRRISEKNVKIEHYHCRSKHPNEQLTWGNLLAACKGGEGGNVRTCDTKKEDDDLAIDPQNQSHIASLRYLPDGEIKSRNFPKFDIDINETLNLNTLYLKQLRVEASDGFIKATEKRLGKGRTWSEANLIKELERIRSRIPLYEFTGVCEYWLERKIRKRFDR